MLLSSFGSSDVHGSCGQLGSTIVSVPLEEDQDESAELRLEWIC